MSVIHKIHVYATRSACQAEFPLWYTYCRGCGWNPGKRAKAKNGLEYFGRDSWDGAFALGVAHQQNANGRGGETNA